MTKEIIDYQTRAEMKIGKKEKNLLGLRSLHIDFINNDEKQGFRVTFVSGLDDPNNAPELVEERRLEKINKDIKRNLNEKLKNDSISMPELRELLRLTLWVLS